MTDEQRSEVINALVNFITRVSNSETATETEVAALPATVNALVNFATNF